MSTGPYRSVSNRPTLEELERNWVDIVLTVLSIIQGLAFNDLMLKMTSVVGFAVRTGHLAELSHGVLCIAILIRIFQTYVTAALDYRRWGVTGFDLFAVFAIGILEYLVFASLELAQPSTLLSTGGVDVPPAPVIHVARFHGYLAAITAIGIFAYLRVHRRLSARKLRGYDANERDIRLQMLNAAGLGVVFLVAVTCVLRRSLTDTSLTLLATLQGAVLLANTWYSLRVTFGSPSRGRRIIVQPATRTQVPAMRVMIATRGERLLDYLLGGTTDERAPLLDELLAQDSGHHLLGYANTLVAVDSSTGSVVGLLIGGVAAATRASGHPTLVDRPTTHAVVRHCGAAGVTRLRERVRVLDWEVPTRGVDGRVRVLLVDDAYHRLGVGKQLVEAFSALVVGRGGTHLVVDVWQLDEATLRFWRKLEATEVGPQRIAAPDFGFGAVQRLSLDVR